MPARASSRRRPPPAGRAVARAAACALRWAYCDALATPGAAVLSLPTSPPRSAHEKGRRYCRRARRPGTGRPTPAARRPLRPGPLQALAPEEASAPTLAPEGAPPFVQMSGARACARALVVRAPPATRGPPRPGPSRPAARGQGRQAAAARRPLLPPPASALPNAVVAPPKNCVSRFAFTVAVPQPPPLPPRSQRSTPHRCRARRQAPPRFWREPVSPPKRSPLQTPNPRLRHPPLLCVPPSTVPVCACSRHN
jgi:hypothetical protein